MDRNLAQYLKKDLAKKPVILVGPRQCGKTFLSQHLFKDDCEYLNFDILTDRKKILKMDWSINKKLLILDEIHKMKKWKNWLKGVFDSNKSKLPILVTGSANLNTYKKVGDSMAGRYFSYRLHPLDIKEILSHQTKKESPEKILDRLLSVSGFPEPYLSNDTKFYTRWQQTHLDVILKNDILDTVSVKNITQLETLSLLLSERVGSTLSYNSLREDLSTDDKSVKRWVDILESSYVVFRIYPYTHKSLVGGIKKAPKIYFYDYCRVENESARLENLVALSLLKEIQNRMDIKGEKFELRFLKNKQNREIDFLITKNNQPFAMIEVKQSEAEPNENFYLFDKYLPGLKKIQLVKNLKEERLTRKNILITPMSQWLSKMEL